MIDKETATATESAKEKKAYVDIWGSKNEIERKF